MTRVTKEDVTIGAENRKQTETSWEQARRTDALVIVDNPTVINVHGAGGVETFETSSGAIFCGIKGKMEEFVREIGPDSTAFAFVCGVVGEHPSTVYQLPGGEMLRAIVKAGDVKLDEVARVAGASIEQVIFFSSVLEAVRLE